MQRDSPNGGKGSGTRADQRGIAQGIAPGSWRRALPLLLPGAIGIVAGGLIAAAIAHDPTRHGVWLVAYLVLVVGVVQLVLAVARVPLAGSAVSRFRVGLECALFNLGSAGVIAGTLGGGSTIVGLATLLFLAALASFFGTRAGDVAGEDKRVDGFLYRGFIVVVALSALVGFALSLAGGP